MIICAAIKMKFKRNNKTVDVVIPGHRHSNCWELAVSLGVPAEREEVEGFLDHKGLFLDRSGAYDHAMMCGQLSDTTLISKRERKESILWSEDIY